MGGQEPKYQTIVVAISVKLKMWKYQDELCPRITDSHSQSPHYVWTADCIGAEYIYTTSACQEVIVEGRMSAKDGFTIVNRRLPLPLVGSANLAHKGA